ncbi:hypothetical protein [Neotabrizicola shimadae]|uniref:Uncharacterized protein n=1 Tax=Neotabrizicola shimadae TaxID=2807096 RepID=A0A8G0ZVK6_9RHOB|nr:hypothetical protein [Neotabrizicola shimadae]QYZ71269.1 hypothetical protein JO391_07125 [Neotabrizicola shimadae]
MGWLLRMSQWARNPPSARMATVILVVVLLCLSLVAVEHIWGWPDWLTVNRVPRRIPS